MPRIPKFNSQIALRTGALSRQPATALKDPGAASQVSRAMAGAGQVIAQVGQKLESIQSKSQLAKANTESYNALSTIEQEAAEDTVTEGYKEKYSKKVSDVKNNVLKTITNRNAQNQFNLEFERDRLDTQFRLNKRYTTLVVDNAKANFILEQDAISEKYFKATTPEEKEVVVDRMASRYNDLVVDGVLTQEAGVKGFKKWKEDLINENIGHDIAIDPEVAKDKLLNKEYGKLSPSETSDWLDVADKKIDRIAEEEKKIKTTNWLNKGGDVIKDLKNQNVADLILLVGNGEINPDLGNALVKWKKDPNAVQYETDKEVYADLAIKSTTPQIDLLKFQNAIGKAIANKDIQAEEAAEFIVIVEDFFEGAIDAKGSQNTFTRALKSAISALELLNFGTDQNFKMIKELIKRGIENKDNPNEVEAISKDIINKNNKELNPSIGNFPEKGQLTVDTNGSIATSFPNGSFENSTSRVLEESNTPTFNSEKEALDAELPKGTLVLINGRKAVIE